jgi:hypothetical protein
MTRTKSRDELVREADLARARLLDTVEKLDQRRHEMLDPQVQLRRQLRPLTVGGFVVVAVAAAGAGLVAHRVATADQRRRRERWRLLRRHAWGATFARRERAAFRARHAADGRGEHRDATPARGVRPQPVSERIRSVA